MKRPSLVSPDQPNAKRYKGENIISSQFFDYRVKEALQGSDESSVAVVEFTSAPQLILKTCKIANETGQEQMEILDTLRRANCPNILYPIDSALLPEQGYFVVFPFIQRTPFPSTFPHIWNSLLEISMAVAGCHEFKIVHCDIKPDNLLLSQGKVYLTDFDHAQRQGSQEDPQFTGTIEYWSPEICKEETGTNDPPRDIWALAVTFMEYVYNQYPFSIVLGDDEKICSNISRARGGALNRSIMRFLKSAKPGDLPWPELLPPSHEKGHVVLQSLLRGMLVLDPAERLTITGVCQFLQSQLE